MAVELFTILQLVNLDSNRSEFSVDLCALETNIFAETPHFSNVGMMEFLQKDSSLSEPMTMAICGRGFGVMAAWN